MASRTPRTPPRIHPAHDVKKAAPPVETNLPVAALVPEPEPTTPPASGVGDRGTEQGVPFYTDGAGRKFVAFPHPKAGEAW